MSNNALLLILVITGKGYKVIDLCNMRGDLISIVISSSTVIVLNNYDATVLINNGISGVLIWCL